MGDINRVPKGFLATLDAKTGGRTPTSSADVLSPVIDLTDYYLADLTLQSQGGTANINAGMIQTFQTLVTVPDGELWLMKYMTSAFAVSSTVGATSYSATAAFRAAANVVGVQRVGQEPAAFNLVPPVVGGGSSITTQFTKPFFLRAGAELGLWIENFGAGPAVVAFLETSFYRLTV